jgi:predicted patatin/cPLA2 family phospholipase
MAVATVESSVENRLIKKQIISAYEEERLHPVLQTMVKFALEGSIPDEDRISMVFEGGGMRGGIMGWMLAAVDEVAEVLDTNWRDCMKEVWGASVGSTGVPYYLSRQVRTCKDAFHSVLAEGGPFISWKRALLRRGPVVKLEYLFDDVMQRMPQFSLDWEKASNTPVGMFMVASNVDAQTEDQVATYFTDFTDRSDCYGGIRASCSIPRLGGGPYPYRGGRFFDAGISINIPVEEALQNAHRILVISGIPEDTPPTRLSTVERMVIIPYLNEYNPILGRLYRSKYDREAELRLKLDRAHLNPEGPSYICTLKPSASQLVGMLERRPSVLVSGGKGAARRVYNAFGIYDPESVETLVQRVVTDNNCLNI